MIDHDPLDSPEARHMTTQARSYLIPEHMIDGLLRYLLHGVMPGDFLRAVLSNDLFKACRHADYINSQRLFQYVNFLYNEAPGDAWGSPEKVEQWARTKRTGGGT